MYTNFCVLLRNKGTLGCACYWMLLLNWDIGDMSVCVYIYVNTVDKDVTTHNKHMPVIFLNTYQLVHHLQHILPNIYHVSSRQTPHDRQKTAMLKQEKPDFYNLFLRNISGTHSAWGRTWENLGFSCLIWTGIPVFSCGKRGKMLWTDL